MEVIAFNGSPRKTWNTATLLQKALDGAASQGAKTKLIHLYDLDFKGCKSCLSCKIKGGENYGKCAINDPLTPILKEVEKADAILLGSPIYFGAVSASMKAFMERLLYPYFRCVKSDDPVVSLFPKKLNNGFIYTMNVEEAVMKQPGWCWDKHIEVNEMFLRRTFGTSESLVCTDTCQVDDFSKLDQSLFDPEKKFASRKERFPQDCQKAFEMGRRFATGA